MSKPYPDLDVSGILGLFRYANTVTGGWLGIMIPFAVFILALFIAVRLDYRLSQSLLSGSWLAFLISALVWAGKMLDGRFVLLFLLLSAGCGIWAYLDR